MADPICRWRNATIKQICEFNQLLPKKVMEKKFGRDLIERHYILWDGSNNFFRTAYQLAAQLGLYYEDDKYLHPRFYNIIDIDYANQYIQKWGRNYYVPNPYTTSLKISDVYGNKPIIINNFLVNYIIDYGNTSWDDLSKILFPNGIGNDDILQNLLNNYSDIQIINGVVSLKKNITKFNHIFVENDPNDKKAFFDHFDVVVNNFSPSPYPLQTIFYGAPGTGKSYAIRQATKGYGNVVRTTFHPDSDYSTFVGCYKPTTKEEPRYTSYGDKALKIKDSNGNPLMENRIVYEFMPQAFLQAYVNAWKLLADANGNDAEPQYLIIEEINRGNCAQIFGDLFQLLDRNAKGFSSYPIIADNDMRKYLQKALDGIKSENINYINGLFDDNAIASKVANGEVLLLPSNLYIWASMNTSDQSLFPIDSAFKRRWDWQYTPICQGSDENGLPLQWKISVGTKDYDWWDFICKINARIGEATSSEDKKLGFFFCNPANGIVSAETFVGKVVTCITMFSRITALMIRCSRTRTKARSRSTSSIPLTAKAKRKCARTR